MPTIRLLAKIRLSRLQYRSCDPHEAEVSSLSPVTCSVKNENRSIEINIGYYLPPCEQIGCWLWASTVGSSVHGSERGEVARELSATSF